MNRNRICPECETEYLPHMEKCSDCGAVLLLPEELRKAKQEKQRIRQKAVENTAVVREGDLDWLRELRAVLADAGIPATVRAADDCGKGRCGGTHWLTVSSDDLERAQERIEEYFMESNPEVRASKELLGRGKCPACGSPVSEEARECADCGLPLVIVEDEEE
jgi:rRNA maturation endonuclease Nob1